MDMKLFQPTTIRGMEVRNRIVYPAIQMNMGLTNRRARAFYTERAQGGAGLIITANTAIDNLASEELWGGPEELAGFIERLRKFTAQVHEAGARIGLQLWQANRFPQGRGTQVAGQEADPGSGDSVAPSPREDMRELTIPEIEAIIYRFAKGARNVRDAGLTVWRSTAPTVTSPASLLPPRPTSVLTNMGVMPGVVCNLASTW